MLWRRRAHAAELAHEGVPLIVIQRQLGHTNLGITSVYVKALTTPRSSRRSTHGERRWFPFNSSSGAELLRSLDAQIDRGVFACESRRDSTLAALMPMHPVKR